MPTKIKGASGIDKVEVGANSFLVGQVSMFAMVTPPAGWLKLNGAAVSRATYSVLFATIGTTFGVGNGSTTFNLPEVRGEFLRCADDGRGIDASRALGSAQAQSMQSHAHSLPNLVSANGGDGWSRGGVGDTGGNTVTGATGSPETRPRNVAFMTCIFAGV